MLEVSLPLRNWLELTKCDRQTDLCGFLTQPLQDLTANISLPRGLFIEKGWNSRMGKCNNMMLLSLNFQFQTRVGGNPSWQLLFRLKHYFLLGFLECCWRGRKDVWACDRAIARVPTVRDQAMRFPCGGNQPPYPLLCLPNTQQLALQEPCKVHPEPGCQRVEGLNFRHRIRYKIHWQIWLWAALHFLLVEIFPYIRSASFLIFPNHYWFLHGQARRNWLHSLS